MTKCKLLHMYNNFEYWGTKCSVNLAKNFFLRLLSEINCIILFACTQLEYDPKSKKCPCQERAQAKGTRQNAQRLV